jgi:PAS domain S-box-containing protein
VKNADDKYKNQIIQLESELSELKIELENIRFQYEGEGDKRLFYQLIADFTFGWELWFEPNEKIKYCSPSCYDLTGFTANEIVYSSGIQDLLVYDLDKSNYSKFLSDALDQVLVIQSLEFRILTRTKQLRWCMMSVRGVYDKQGKYLGIRASVHDITRLKKAMGHIQELEKGKEFESRTKHRLQTELELKDRELVSFLLQLSQKNELLAKAANLLKNRDSGKSASLRLTIEKLDVLFGSNVIQQIDWRMIENQMEKLHPDFLRRLQVKHPGISVKDKKLCSYIRLGLSSKEISGLVNITPKSIEIARVRLRKKLKLPHNIRLVNYLGQI